MADPKAECAGRRRLSAPSKVPALRMEDAVARADAEDEASQLQRPLTHRRSCGGAPEQPPPGAGGAQPATPGGSSASEGSARQWVVQRDTAWRTAPSAMSLKLGQLRQGDIVAEAMSPCLLAPGWVPIEPRGYVQACDLSTSSAGGRADAAGPLPAASVAPTVCSPEPKAPRATAPSSVASSPAPTVASSSTPLILSGPPAIHPPQVARPLPAPREQRPSPVPLHMSTPTLSRGGLLPAATTWDAEAASAATPKSVHSVQSPDNGSSLVLSLREEALRLREEAVAAREKELASQQALELLRREKAELASELEELRSKCEEERRQLEAYSRQGEDMRKRLERCRDAVVQAVASVDHLYAHPHDTLSRDQASQAGVRVSHLLAVEEAADVLVEEDDEELEAPRPALAAESRGGEGGEAGRNKADATPLFAGQENLAEILAHGKVVDSPLQVREPLGSRNIVLLR